MKKTVKSGEFCEAKTSDIVVVEKGGWCGTHGSSRPKVKIKHGGRCERYGNSKPEITEENNED